MNLYTFKVKQEIYRKSFQGWVLLSYLIIFISLSAISQNKNAVELNRKIFINSESKHREIADRLSDRLKEKDGKIISFIATHLAGAETQRESFFISETAKSKPTLFFSSQAFLEKGLQEVNPESREFFEATIREDAKSLFERYSSEKKGLWEFAKIERQYPNTKVGRASLLKACYWYLDRGFYSHADSCLTKALAKTQWTQEEKFLLLMYSAVLFKMAKDPDRYEKVWAEFKKLHQDASFVTKLSFKNLPLAQIEKDLEEKAKNKRIFLPELVSSEQPSEKKENKNIDFKNRKEMILLDSNREDAPLSSVFFNSEGELFLRSKNLLACYDKEAKTQVWYRQLSDNWERKGIGNPYGYDPVYVPSGQIFDRTTDLSHFSSLTAYKNFVLALDTKGQVAGAYIESEKVNSFKKTTLSLYDSDSGVAIWVKNKFISKRDEKRFDSLVVTSAPITVDNWFYLTAEFEKKLYLIKFSWAGEVIDYVKIGSSETNAKALKNTIVFNTDYLSWWKGALYLSTSDGFFIKFDPISLTADWALQFNMLNEMYSDQTFRLTRVRSLHPLFQGDQVILIDPFFEKVRSVNVNSGALQWTVDKSAAENLLPIDSEIFAVTTANGIEARFLETGNIAWTNSVSSNGKGLLLGNKVAIPNKSGAISIFDATSGKRMGVLPVTVGVAPNEKMDLKIQDGRFIITTPRKLIFFD